MLFAALMSVLSLAQASAVDHEEALPSVRIDRGGTFLIGRNPKGELVEDGGAAAPLGNFDIDAITRLKRERSDAHGSKGVILRSQAPEPPIQTGAVRFSFVEFANGKESVLIIENGFPRSFHYNAKIKRSGKVTYTDVCQTLPRKRSYEHWPFPIESIEITNFHPVEWEEGAPLVCK